MVKHIYDIDLMDIFQKIESKNYLVNSTLPANNPLNILEYMEEYCLINGLQKDHYKSNSIIINPSDVFFQSFLSCQLAFCEPYEISLLLDYHQNKVGESRGQSEKEFKDFIQYRILPNTNRISMDGKDIRGVKIKNWLQNIPEIVPPEIVYTEMVATETKVQDNKFEFNKYPHIFITANDFNFFEALIESTVPKENPKVADFAFIFHKLFNQKPNAIHQNVTHKTFIDFLNSEYEADIYDSKLNKREPKSKMIVYDSLLNKFYPNSK